MFREVMLGKGMKWFRIAVEIVFWVTSVAWIGLHFAGYGHASDIFYTWFSIPALIYILADDTTLFFLNGRTPKSRNIKD